MKKIVALFCIIMFSGCTAVTVRTPQGVAQIERVKIRENPKVIVADFVQVMRDGFDRHGIASDLITPDATVSPDDFVVTYTALRSWDFTPYLSHAEVRIERGGRQIAYAEYHLRGKGGFSLVKWQSVKAKMDPVMDQLLSQVVAKKGGAKSFL